ncbi:MAG: DsbA family protein [Alphaproteobacteria bacterium]|nr:DsbA family protein [Alphaproteobacteria bacterium]
MTRRILAAATFIALTSLAVPAEPRAQDGADKEQIETIVRDFLLENPKVIVDALEKFQRDQQKAMEQSQVKNLEKHKAFLYADERPGGGNPQGDVTVVELFDYNCGYCKRALEDVLGVLEGDKNLRIVLIELPILGPTSELAARWALAAQEQGKYFPFHVAVMQHNGPKSEEALTKIAAEIGLDVEKLKADSRSEKVTAELRKNREVAMDLGISGTPAFIVDDSIIRGYVGEERLQEEIGKAR